PQADEFERLSLYHETTGGEAALARMRRDDAIRVSGHAPHRAGLVNDPALSAARQNKRRRRPPGGPFVWCVASLIPPPAVPGLPPPPPWPRLWPHPFRAPQG